MARKKGDTYKKPPLDEFIKAVGEGWGSVSSVARILHVNRGTVQNWIANDLEYNSVMVDAAGKTCDQIISSLVAVAIGIPKYEVDDDGKKRMVGWIQYPDVGSAKYLLETLGRKIGWNQESDPFAIPEQSDEGLDINAWIKAEIKTKRQKAKRERMSGKDIKDN